MSRGTHDWWAQGLQSMIAMPAEGTEIIEVIDSTPVPGGELAQVTVRAPSGYIYEIISMMLAAPPVPGAASGTHSFEVRSEQGTVPITYGESNYNDCVEYICGIWHTATVGAIPTTEIAQIFCVRGLRIDSDSGIVVDYRNMTGATQTDARIMYFWVRKVKVTEV